MKECKICGNVNNNKIYTAREMMFGLKDEFDYLECNECGCLQIISIPQDLIKYYPPNYYSYQTLVETDIIQTGLSKTAKRIFKKKFLNGYLQGNAVSGKLMSKFQQYYPWIKRNTISNTSRILDIGCGTGELLLKMYNDGFLNLTGVDPYIIEDIQYKCGVNILKKQLEDIHDKYDFIMLHHSFEHMDEPLDVLKKIYSLMDKGGMVIIRIPVSKGHAWRKYGVNWVQLDAPRHFFLHTTQSMQILSNNSGFILDDIVYDSYDLQFIGSEMYLRGIPLIDDHDFFSAEQISDYKEEAGRLNRINDGDAACFYLKK
ncbi:MAG: class I SAM-dependent methyltransferase [Chitinophagaceae bacterium]